MKLIIFLINIIVLIVPVCCLFIAFTFQLQSTVFADSKGWEINLILVIMKRVDLFEKHVIILNSMILNSMIANNIYNFTGVIIWILLNMDK